MAEPLPAAPATDSSAGALQAGSQPPVGSPAGRLGCPQGCLAAAFWLAGEQVVPRLKNLTAAVGAAHLPQVSYVLAVIPNILATTGGTCDPVQVCNVSGCPSSGWSFSACCACCAAGCSVLRPAAVDGRRSHGTEPVRCTRSALWCTLPPRIVSRRLVGPAVCCAVHKLPRAGQCLPLQCDGFRCAGLPGAWAGRDGVGSGVCTCGVRAGWGVLTLAGRSGGSRWQGVGWDQKSGSSTSWGVPALAARHGR